MIYDEINYCDYLKYDDCFHKYMKTLITLPLEYLQIEKNKYDT